MLDLLWLALCFFFYLFLSQVLMAMAAMAVVMTAALSSCSAESTGTSLPARSRGISPVALEIPARMVHAVEQVGGVAMVRSIHSFRTITDEIQHEDPTYCGTGCPSNCDAKAECGRYASPPNKMCPLNVCCSEHGL